MFENSKTLAKDSLHFKLELDLPFVELIGKLLTDHQKIAKTVFHFLGLEMLAMESVTVYPVDLHSEWRGMLTNLIVVVQKSNVLDQDAMVELLPNLSRLPQFDEAVQQNNKMA